MIVLKRLQSFALSCAGTHLLYAFSSARPVINRLSDAGQQAVWANQIIKLIKNDDSYPLKQTDPTILDKIKALEVPKTVRLQSAFNRNDGRYVNRDEVVKMMTEGIVLNPIVFAQQRVQHAKQQKINKSADNSTSKQIYSGNFIFYPNYLGTSCMFKELESKIQSNILLTGGFGISKTISIIFYIHLSNFITKYAVQCSKNPQLLMQLDLLKEQNLLQEPFLKYLYWSADSNPSFNNIQKVVVQQAVELQEKDKQELRSIKQWSDFQKRLRQLYPSNIEIVPVVDQFNLIASLMRKWNSYLSINKIDGKEELFGKKKDAFLTQKGNTYQLAQILSIAFNRFIKLGRSYVLNSSLSIQKDLLRHKGFSIQSGDIYSKIGLVLRWLKIHRMPYERQLETERGKTDAWNIAWFEIWRRLKRASPQAIEDIRQKFLTATKNKDASKFFRFVYLRGYLDSIEHNVNFGQQKISISIEKLQSIIQEYPKYCLNMEKQLFKRMFIKIQPWCRDLMLLMHEQAQKCVKNEALKNQLAKFDLTTFKNIEIVQKINIQQKIVEIIANQAGEPFPFHLEDGCIKLNWTFLQFYELTTHVLFPNVAQSLFTGYSTFSKVLLSKGTARGNSIQTAIIESLTPGSILKYYIKPLTSIQLQIAGQVSFIPFNSKLTINQNVNDKDKFKKNFDSLLSKCFENPNSFFLAKPSYKEYGIERTSQTSKAIDFVIGVYQSEEKKYLIRTFDTTVEESPSQKVKEFNTEVFQQLSMLAKEGGYTSKDIEFQHIIPSLKQTCGTIFGDSKNGFTPTLIETNLFKMSVQKSTNGQALNAMAITLLRCQTILDERRIIEKLSRAAK